ncbi:hypothetical protein JQC91_13985 [Jannaschia sp. Os4]|uniref:hypothetical protein n=1 Tax=Jannaschia sp. Os4 TaxID=2807617 RepID=UPI001939E8CC|nr:hypothetical protein [Jannaschia sp. Os4]MBM2577413.1 hypothetical protein [Jannaschia sp. Os4]
MAHTDRDPYTPTPKPVTAAHPASPGARVAAGVHTHGPQGTTHDPNSVTTGTEVEPSHAEVYPPKGETEAEHRRV